MFLEIVFFIGFGVTLFVSWLIGCFSGIDFMQIFMALHLLFISMYICWYVFTYQYLENIFSGYTLLVKDKVILLLKTLCIIIVVIGITLLINWFISFCLGFTFTKAYLLTSLFESMLYIYIREDERNHENDKRYKPKSQKF
jgi:hypothetical protein